MAASRNLSATVPLEYTAITKRSLRECIPKECFQRSYAKSLGHLAKDIALVYGTYSAATFAAAALPSVLSPLVWLMYWFFQGIFFTALWVLAHECGHGGFSDSKLLNDCVGFVLHSSLLTPYFSWAISHAKHHSYTNHMTKGETWVPARAVPGGQTPGQKLFSMRYGRQLGMVLLGLLGWWEYLRNNSGSPPQNRGQSHFNPGSKALFRPHHQPLVLASNAGMLAMLAILGVCIHWYGFAAVVRVYSVPQTIANTYLVVITYMQHTHPEVPHFDADDWTWLRGCLSTVDRSMGPWADAALHHIVDSHVVHHIFSDMPFYGAKAATPYVRAHLGEYYKAVPPREVLGSPLLGWWHEFSIQWGQNICVRKGKEGFWWFTSALKWED